MESGSSYDTSEPDVSDWNQGWGESGVTGWDYVGQVNGASAVYLGNGWVLTADHVGAGDFTLDGTTYDVVSGSSQLLYNDQSGTGVEGTQVDLVLFQVSSAPDLPALTISSTNPAPFPSTAGGQSVVMIGYGGGQGETWGQNIIIQTNSPTQVDSDPYRSLDFITEQQDADPSRDALLVTDDSGGGDFIYNAATGEWELAGINEGVSGSDSYMIQLSDYESQIESITDAAAVPEPPAGMLLVLGLAGAWLVSRRARKNSALGR